MANCYQCSICKEVYEKGRSDEESIAEAGPQPVPGDELEVVCDDCYKMIGSPNDRN